MSQSKIRVWTVQEESSLIALRKKRETISVMSKNLNRTPSSINAKIDRMHLYGPSHKMWTEQDLEFVRVNYRHTSRSRKDIASSLHRSEGSIDFAIRSLGLQQIRRTRWSEEEDDLLRDNVGKHSVNHLSKLLHKSVNQIVSRIKTLRLHRSCRDEWYTTGDVASIIGCSRQKVRDHIASGCLKARSHYENRQLWEVRREDIRAFICKYPSELQNRNCDILQIVDIFTNGALR